jgi:hypothetical protein
MVDGNEDGAGELLLFDAGEGGGEVGELLGVVEMTPGFSSMLE